MDVPAHRNLPEVIAARKQYALWRLRNSEEYARAIFVDESGFNICTTASRGLSLLSVRPMACHRHTSMPNLTLIVACGKDGVYYYELLIGPVSGAIFACFLDSLVHHLLERGELQRGRPRLLIMDNLKVHVAKDTAAVVLKKNEDVLQAKLLPPWSPFLDMTEEVFALWKMHFCELIKRYEPLGPPGVGQLIVEAGAKITAEHCNAFFRHVDGFLSDCTQGLPVSSEAILDRLHEGDEGQMQRDALLVKLGFGLHANEQRFVSDAARQGTAPPPPANIEEKEHVGEDLRPPAIVSGEIIHPEMLWSTENEEQPSDEAANSSTTIARRQLASL